MSYTASNITVLEGLDAVRVRPGMYIGSTGTRGLHHLVWEILDNSIDEALGGHANRIIITLEDHNKISIEDNGRGIPVDMHESGINALQLVMTKLHAGGKFNDDNYKFSGGLHGVGLSVVNALSNLTEVEVYKNGYVYKQSFERGNPKTELTKTKSKENKTGTKITFIPDDTIFETTKFSLPVIHNKAKELSYLNKGITIVVSDNKKIKEYHSKGGIVEMLVDSLPAKNNITKPIVFSDKFNMENNRRLEVDLAMTYHTEDEFEISFVNNIKTVDGGTHVTGFRSGLLSTINTLNGSNYTYNDIKDGLCYILSIRVTEPQFESQTKEKLGNPELTKIIRDMVTTHLADYFKKKKDVFTTITDRINLMNEAKKRAKLAKETTLKKHSLDSSLPGKLSSCISKKPEDNELYIVEGNSAGGSAKQGRDRKTQAILPIRGKIINVEKATIDKIAANQEVKDIISALGCGMGANYDPSKLRYHKVILMTDADSDGSHIRMLLLTVLYKLIPNLIKDGKVYVANPPLFRVRYKGKDTFFNDENQKNKFVKNKTGYNVQRYKGLGQMDPEELWDTTMNPENRLLHRVTIANVKKAEKMINMCMGTEVNPRREYIDNNAYKLNVNDIDS